MLKILPLILATCMVGEAGWTVQITGASAAEETVETVQYFCRNEVETAYEAENNDNSSQLIATSSQLVHNHVTTSDDGECNYTETESDSGWTYLGTQRVTGYTWTGNPMANGVYPSYGWCACNGLPLGSVVYIEGLGYFTVGDRGGMTDSYWIDVYYDTVSECYAVTGYYDIYLVEE